MILKILSMLSQNLGGSFKKVFSGDIPHLYVNPKPAHMSVARAMCTSKAVVDEHFKRLKEIRTKHNIPAERVWNVDETGVESIPHNKRVIALKGTKCTSRL